MNTIADRSQEYLYSLVSELISLPRETEWLEFKKNNTNPKEIGEYISALSNSAALAGKANAYLIWGVDDATHNIIGSEFDPKAQKQGNEELESWLLRLLSPKIAFEFFTLNYDGKKLVLLEVPSAYRHPVQFQNMEYIRVGSYKKPLKEFPEKERTLWQVFDNTPFESMNAMENVNDEDVLQLLDYPSYFNLMNLALPDNKLGILSRLDRDHLIAVSEIGKWNITNLGALLFANKLSDFSQISRKAMRVIFYKDNTRINDAHSEQTGNRGYACGFEGLVSYINNLLPSNEVLNQALRKEVPIYPERAVRELVANALIHQDFFASGTGPLIEVFSDRMEITNPGVPLIEAERFLDSPPQSRNESLASMMRRIGVCEERGSGIDKVVWETEHYQLPPPRFEVTNSNTRSILFAPKDFSDMSKDDRIWACYLHCSLKYVNHEDMNNTSMRQRLGIDEKNSAIASRIIKATVDAGLIRLFDKSANRKAYRYVPSWA